MKRLFVAITFPKGEKFLSAYGELRKSLMSDKIRWVDTDKMHLTLKFIGETESSLTPYIIRALEKSVEGISPFDIEVKDAGVFGSSYNPRVIWFGITKNIMLDKLASNIVNALDDIGIKKDRQNFVPHITAGRIKNIFDKQHLRQKIGQYNNEFFQTSRINRIELFESVLSKTGPDYYLINKFELTDKQATVNHEFR